MSEATDGVAAKREHLRESVKKVGEGIHEIGDVAKQSAKEVAGKSKERVTLLAEQLEQHVREKPVQSVLLAVGVGVLVGMLLRR